MALLRKKIVVVGYGAAGSQFTAQAAKNKSYEITVITPFDFQEVSLRMTQVVAVGPKEHDSVLFNLLREPDVNYIIDTCASISDGVVTTGNGQNVPFDACVIAVGQRIPTYYPSLTENTKELRKAAIKEFHEKILSARNIVISGGGPVGVETACDIKLRYGDKKITLIHPAHEVLDMMHDPFRLKATAQLEKIGVELIVDDRVASQEGGQVTLKSGKRITCDLYIPAHAIGGNCGFLPSASKDERNYAKVDDTFKVQGYHAVFALGDCSNYDRVKTYPRIDDQMPVVLANVNATVNNKPLQHHVKGKSFMGSLKGPLLVALGHEAPGSYGVGPDLPGCMGVCCWFCCCCQTPAGSMPAKMKSDFNKSISPKPGVGLH